jgi:hypothetical protein
MANEKPTTDNLPIGAIDRFSIVSCPFFIEHLLKGIHATR